MKEILCRSKKYGDHFAQVDDADFEILNRFKWYLKVCTKGNIYCRAPIYKNGKRINILMHRFLLDCSIGEIIDHKDGNGMNNQRSNIRRCTHQQNAQNYRTPLTNKSGFKGVSFYKPTGKYVVYVKSNKKNLNVGYFTDLITAAHAYNEAAKKYYGEFANLNVIPK